MIQGSSGTGMNSSGHEVTPLASQLSTISSFTLPNNYATVSQSQDLVEFKIVPTDLETGYSKMVYAQRSHTSYLPD